VRVRGLPPVVKDVGVQPPNDGQAAADDARPRPPEDATLPQRRCTSCVHGGGGRGEGGGGTSGEVQRDATCACAEVVAEVVTECCETPREGGVRISLRMLMSAPPGEAVWRRGVATHTTRELYPHPSMETIRTSIRRPNSPSSPNGRTSGCTLSPARSPPSRRSPSKHTLGTSASRSSLGSCCTTATCSARSPFATSSGSASSVSPSCHAAGFGLGSSRGATDYMPFALAPDTAFFKEVVRSERRAAACAQQRSFGRVAPSQGLASGHVRLATAFPASPARPIAGTTSPFASVAPPARPSFESTGRVFQRG
jgi:hypothetical protein